MSARPAQPAAAEHARHRGHRRRHQGLAVLIVAVVTLALAASSALVVRSIQKQAGMGVVSTPALHAIEAEQHEGPFSVEVRYSSIAAPKGALAQTSIAWDDAWFFDDPAAYNHELATTCAVLSEMANAESDYYQAATDVPAYMEEALGRLGFSEVSTTSYQYRSEIIDEVLDLVTGRADVVAYTIARKVVSDGTGREKALYLVAVRGSYGAEWISDANMGGLSADADASASSETGEVASVVHQGFGLAVDGLIADLQALAREHHDDALDATLLFCGHSRGAAIANLAAAHAIDMAGTAHAVADATPAEVRAYTFATPNVTRADDARDARYDAIFNVLNPADLVPRLPLAAWGYARHGRDIYLPRYDEEGFDEKAAAMRAAYEQVVGTGPTCDPADAKRVDSFERHVGADVPTVQDILTFEGIRSIALRFAADINVVRVLASHYPDVYIAWMQVIGPADLTVAA